MPNKTLAEAAAEIHLLAQEVKVLMKGEFQTKAASRRLFKFAVLTLIASVLASYFFTISTVSTCFLLGASRPDICNVIPGYSESEERNRQLIKEFNELRERSTKNERRISRLENK